MAEAPRFHAGMTLGEVVADAVAWIRQNDADRWAELRKIDRDGGGMLLARRDGNVAVISLAGVELARVPLDAPCGG